MSGASFDFAQDVILRPSGLDEGRLQQVLDSVMSRGIDHADLYFQLSREESWALEDGIVKEGSASIEQGVGVRAMAGEKTGFAYSDEILLPALEEASGAARAIARSGRVRRCRAGRRPAQHRCICPSIRWTDSTTKRKSRGLMKARRETRKLDPRVKQVMASRRGRARGRAGRGQRRHAGRRRSAAGALQCFGHR